MKNEAVEGLAERIAKAIAGESQNPYLESILAKLENIDGRIDRLEMSSVAANSELAPQYSQHPSLDKLNVAEAIADAIFSKDKACTFEPSKPCDHCSMCSSRGF
ncbi:hypothetical protein BH10ACI2_BH10ACI2_21000 [soil metagenome]